MDAKTKATKPKLPTVEQMSEELMAEATRLIGCAIEYEARPRIEEWVEAHYPLPERPTQSQKEVLKMNESNPKIIAADQREWVALTFYRGVGYRRRPQLTRIYPLDEIADRLNRRSL